MAGIHHLTTPFPRSCPICESTKRKKLFGQTFAMFSEESLLSGYDVVLCSQCGFGYADNIPSQAKFDEYYRNMSKYEYVYSGGQESSFDMDRFEAIAGLITPFIQSPQASILDIGCATGGLLNKIRANGFYNVSGLDPSLTCAQAAWNLYQIPVQTGTISNIKESNQYDFIILVGVLEHIRELEVELNRLREMLTNGGRLFIEVPDALHFDRFFDAPFQQFSMEHVNFFSPISLQNLMSSNGFETVHITQLHRNHSQESIMPVVSAIFEKQPPSTTFPALIHCTKTEKALAQYIAHSNKFEKGIKQVIDGIAVSGTSLLVWGTGTHTLRLMKISNLSKANIIAFVDSNPRYQGKQLFGAPVIAPQDVFDYGEPILISSRVFQSDIVNNIRNELQIKNELILLYGETDGGKL
jgi:2-polyprenyl-3-methyl-5-hydroxy-6-metoxy-1,4-benzoquinol methylase